MYSIYKTIAGFRENNQVEVDLCRSLDSNVICLPPMPERDERKGRHLSCLSIGLCLPDEPLPSARC